MKLALGPYIRFSRILLFPLAMVIYDFSAYLTTDLIQPGIIHIIREFEADVALAPASVSLYLAGGLALQWLLGPLSDRIGRRPVLLTGAIIFALACFSMIFVTSIDQYLIARFIQGTSICFISTVGYVSIQEAFDEKESIRIMAALTSIVLLAPVIGPLAGAGLMNFLHWKLLFAIIGAMSLLAWALLIFNMPETVTSQGRGFRPGEVFSEFVRAFKQPVVLTGALALSFSNLPIITIVLLAPVIGPLAGAGLMNFLHWKLLFAIIGAMSLLAWALLIFNMPETVTSQGRGFRPGEVFSEFVRAFKQPVVLTGALALSFSNLPIITWVALSPVILIDDGGMSRGAYAWTQVPVFGGVIIASIIVARFIKDPTSPRFIWRTIPIQLTGLLVLLAGNIAWPHTWWWSVSGTSLYALGTGLLFPVLFRFALFSHSLPKGTVSATINIVALSFMAASVEVARWVYFQAGGRIAFHCLALIAGIVVIMLVSRLLKLRQQHLLQPA